MNDMEYLDRRISEAVIAGNKCLLSSTQETHVDLDRAVNALVNASIHIQRAMEKHRASNNTDS